MMKATALKIFTLTLLSVEKRATLVPRALLEQTDQLVLKAQLANLVKMVRLDPRVNRAQLVRKVSLANRVRRV
jgi:hypothetical protein